MRPAELWASQSEHNHQYFRCLHQCRPRLRQGGGRLLELLAQSLRAEGGHRKRSDRADRHPETRDMNVPCGKRTGSEGSMLLIGLVATGIVGFVLAAYLVLLGA